MTPRGAAGWTQPAAEQTANVTNLGKKRIVKTHSKCLKTLDFAFEDSLLELFMPASRAGKPGCGDGLGMESLLPNDFTPASPRSHANGQSAVAHIPAPIACTERIIRGGGGLRTVVYRHARSEAFLDELSDFFFQMGTQPTHSPSSSTRKPRAST